MDKSRDNLRELYSLLESLANKNSEELIDSYSDDKIQAICLLSKELLRKKVYPNEITEDIYVEMIHGLRKSMIHWSRELGEAIIAADDEYKKKNIHKTIRILEVFENDCPAFFYKSIAQAQIMKYKERANKEGLVS